MSARNGPSDITSIIGNLEQGEVWSSSVANSRVGSGYFRVDCRTTRAGSKATVTRSPRAASATIWE